MVSDPAGRSVGAARPLMPPSNIAGCSRVSMPLEAAHLRISSGNGTPPSVMLFQSAGPHVSQYSRIAGQQALRLYETSLEKCKGWTTPVQSILLMTSFSTVAYTRTRTGLISIRFVELVQQLQILRLAAYRLQACKGCRKHWQKL